MSPTTLRRRKKLNLECNICKKRYTKREHLQRHELIHTGAKPFRCATCERSFSRQDVLNRHYRIHQSPSRTQEYSQSRLASALPVQESAPDPALFMNQDHNITFPEDCSSLLWSDSGDLLQSIISMGTGLWDDEPQIPSQVQPLGISLYPTNSPSCISPSDQSTIVEDGERAIKSLSGLISDTLCSVTTPASLTGLTARFLDSCLHMFFKNIIPIFPVIHQPTFVFPDCPAPLLLNAIALGSLFLGTPGATIKADALWRLAHTAVATSWYTMISQRRAYDSCNGVNLALTVLLSQIYAALSRNKTLRMTSQVFHGIAIHWASHCGMYETVDRPPLPSSNDSIDTISHAWKHWVAQETRLRTLLGLYIVDGIVSQFSGNPTFARHMANPLALPGSDRAFYAQTADRWLEIMKENTDSYGSDIRFCDIFRHLFATDETTPTRHTPQYGNSLYHYKIVLEGLRSLISEANKISPPPVGIPTKAQISCTVNRLRAHLIQDERLSPTDQLVSLLQWHSIALDLVVNTARGTRRLCYMNGISQNIFGGDSRDEKDIDPRGWTQSRDARIALLHAWRIQDLAARLPLGRSYDVNIPGAVFAAATTYSAFALAGAEKVILPVEIDWEAVLSSTGAKPTSIEGIFTQETLAFINGTFNTPGLVRDLSYELISLRSLLRGLSLQWGVAQEMEEVVSVWIERCS